MSVPGSTQARHCIHHEPSGEVLCKTYRIRPHCVETSLAISVWDGGFRAEAACTKQSVHNADSVHDNDLTGDRPARKSVSSWVIMLGGFLLSAGARTQSVIAPSSSEAENIAATAATSTANYIQSLFLWRSSFRPGGQAPQWKCAGLLSTTTRK